MTAPVAEELAPERQTSAWIWQGVHLSTDDYEQLQPPWQLPDVTVIESDVGHHVTRREMIDGSVESVRAGAVGVHLHIVEDGTEVGDIGVWREALAEVKSRLDRQDVIVNRALRGRTMADNVKEIESGLFDVMPIQPSYDPDWVRAATSAMRDHGVKPEIIVFEGADVVRARYELIERGAVDLPANWLVVPNSPFIGSPMPDPMSMMQELSSIVRCIQALDPEGFILVCASGRASSFLSTAGLLLGHHMRPGLGETRWRHPHRSVDFTAAAAIRDAVAVADALGRPPATAAQFRELAGLRPAVATP